MSRVCRNVLALNLGSASLKAATFDLKSGREHSPDPPRSTGRASVVLPRHAPTEEGQAGAALAQIITGLPLAAWSPDIVVHRIVHGADRPGPAELTPDVLASLETLSAWAPIHQPAALALVAAATLRWPDARQVGVFDTSWHRTMPEKHRVFPIPYALFARGIKRYGFHGLAFQSAMRKLRRAAPDFSNGRLVLAHLGGGTSLCAVLDGRSVKTTMGLTPLGGVAMSSRSGSLDPGVLLHLQRGLGMGPSEIDRVLWTQSGLKGLSEESGDMQALLGSATEGARRAIDVYVSEIVQGIAAMAACVGGIDGLVFSGGIGTHAARVRAGVGDALEWLGLRIDAGLNERGSVEISAPDASARTFVLAVDEEEEMAAAVAESILST